MRFGSSAMSARRVQKKNRQTGFLWFLWKSMSWWFGSTYSLVFDVALKSMLMFKEPVELFWMTKPEFFRGEDFVLGDHDSRTNRTTLAHMFKIML
jgi:hypothetical protein